MNNLESNNNNFHLNRDSNKNKIKNSKFFLDKSSLIWYTIYSEDKKL